MMDGLLLQGADAAFLAAPVLAGLFDFLRTRKKAAGTPASGDARPAFPPMEAESGAEVGAPDELATHPGAASGIGGHRARHMTPRIVKAYGPPAPGPLELESEILDGLPGAQPRVAKVASEEEEEEGEIEDMAREAIESCKVMLATLAEGGMNIGIAERQLAMAESMFQQSHFPEAVNYASKAMDLAEDLEADRDRCPKCHAETKPRWLLCPKCGQPLR